MRKLLVSAFGAVLVGLALVAGSPPSSAWLAQGGGGGGGGYVGPGDVVSALDYFALRAYSSATRGNKLVNVCTTIAAVDTCADMFSDATTGALVITVIGGAACNTGTQPYNIKTWYDLGTNGVPQDQVEGTVANRAVLSTCTGSTAAASFSGTFVSYLSANPFTQAQPYEIIWNARRTAGTAQVNVFESSSATLQDGYFTSANQGYGFSGSVVTFTASDAACHVIELIHNGASGSIGVDGSVTSSQNFGANGPTAETFSLGGFTTGRYPTMLFHEGGLITGASPASLNSNISAYWGANC